MAHFYQAGEGIPLIFLHGVGNTGRVWQAQLDHFQAAFCAIALDLPGYGKTPPLAENNFPNLADWLLQTIRENEWRQPILVGNSYGGMIVQEFLARHAGNAQAVVLFGTSPAFGKKDGEWQRNFIKARLQPFKEGKTMAELAPIIVKSLAGSGALPEQLRLAEQDVASVSDEAFQTGILTLISFDQRANLSNIDIPCLVLAGEEDASAPPSMMHKMATYIPNAKFGQMAKLGHIAHIENPPLFNKILHDFLESL